MRCETKLCTAYGITGPNKEHVTPLKTTRPVRPSDKYTCWQFKALHTVTFENEQDYNDIFKALGQEDAGINMGGLTEEEVLKYISHKYFADKELVVKNRFGSHLYRWKYNYKDQMSIGFYLKETAKEITKPSAKEQEYWNKQNNIHVNDELIKSFFLDNLYSILDKYGIIVNQFNEYNMNIAFKDNETFVKFVNKMLEETVLKEIHTLGLNATINQTATNEFINRAGNINMIDLLTDDGLVVDQNKLNAA